ncbi:MAG: DUF4118 domain-containing protein [Lachnospiraceae bacterium]|nr:DUF4118 domain-containing protein [Lachnospiraceae bacterium]
MAHETETKETFPAEHVLVCLSPSPTNKKIICEASKLAKAFHANFTALYVAKSQENSLTPEDSERLHNNFRYAEDKGAAITSVIAENIPFAIAEFARVSGVTKIVIGRSNTKRYHFWDKPPLTEQLILIAPNIDIYIIPDSKNNNKINPGNKPVGQIIPTWRDLVITSIILAGMTLLGICFSKLGFTEANIIMVYIFGALLSAIMTKSPLCSLISSFCSVLLFNYFFTAPRLTFHVFEPGYSFTFIIMLITALLTGSLAYRLKDIARESAQSAFHMKVLFDTNQLLQKNRTTDEIMKVLANQVLQLLDKDVIMYSVKEGILDSGYIYTTDGDGNGVKTSGYENEVVKWVFENKKRAGATTGVFPDSKYLYLAIRIKKTVFGIMGVKVDKKVMSSFEYSILLSILGEGALALENLENEKAKEKAYLMAQNEKLRANILRTISHDLRTPLTSISGNASNLLNHYKILDDDILKQIFSDIYDDSEWLIRLVENLLSVTRFENGEMKLNKSPEILSDVIDEALKHIDRSKDEHQIYIQPSEEIVMAQLDAKLVIQVIINIVNNAIKYTQKGSIITIKYGSLNEYVYVSISDNGPGMDNNTREHAFDMFYTGQNGIADGKRSMGLGLALCKAVSDAHEGRIEILDNKPSGCIITFYIKKGEININE